MKYPRIALFALAFVASSLVAGTVYGWPPLRALLLRERGELSEKRLARHFTAGSWSVQGGRFVAGVSRDRVGTRFTCCACLAFVVGGALALGASEATNDAALTLGMFGLGLGSGVQLCVQPVAALFPESASTVMSSRLSFCFCASLHSAAAHGPVPSLPPHCAACFTVTASHSPSDASTRRNPGCESGTIKLETWKNTTSVQLPIRK